MEAPTGGALLDQIFEQGLRPLEESELAERLCLAEHGLVVRVVLRQRLFRAKLNVDRTRGVQGSSARAPCPRSLPRVSSSPV